MGNQCVVVIACLKTLLFVYNIIFWLSGILFLVVGIWAELKLHKYVVVTSEIIATGPLVVIGIGCLIIILGSVAFYSIIKGQPVLLFLYGGFVGCVDMLIAGLFLSMACHIDCFDRGLQEGLTKTLVNYSPDKFNFDDVQAGLKCCGVTNYTDWTRLSPNRVIPLSCCIDLNHCVTANYSDVYQQGCYKALSELVEANMDFLINIAIGVSFFPVIGTGLSWTLAMLIKTANYEIMNL